MYPIVNGKIKHSGGGTFPNLFCSHSPFQIDGNYGGAAGIGEMVLQSQEGFINLLPALPDSWNTGSFRGMRVRGGASVDLDWKGGRVVKALLASLVTGEFTVKMPAGINRAKVMIGKQENEYTGKAFTVNLNKGEVAVVSFF